MKKKILVLILFLSYSITLNAQKDSLKYLNILKDTIISDKIVNINNLNYNQLFIPIKSISFDSLIYYKKQIVDTVPFKAFIKISNNFTFNELVNVYKTLEPIEFSDYATEKLYFIMLREYNYELIYAQNNKISNLNITPSTQLYNCDFIWFLNFAALQLVFEEPISETKHGNTDVTNLKDAFNNGMLRFNSINIDTE